MKGYLKLAWRNIWRNKRRTLITAASVFFAVFFSVMMKGFHLGSWIKMIDGILHSYAGYIQVHGAGYWKNKTLDYTFTEDKNLLGQIKKNKEITSVVPRFESFALASAGIKTKGVLVIGIEPGQENNFTKLKEKIVKGRYLDAKDNSVILSERLAKFLKLDVHDTIVLLGQGYQGNSAAGKYHIKGVVKLPIPEFDNKMVYLTIENARELYSAPDRLTSLTIDLKSDNRLDDIVSEIKENTDREKYEVMSWKEMLVELNQQYIADNVGGYIFLTLLYLIVGFGIFGTVLMMTTERMREFGIMIAVGMQRRILVSVIATEMFLISFIGLITGMIFSLPVVAWFHYHPIRLSGDAAKGFAAWGMEPLLPFALQSDYIIMQGMIVAVIVTIAISYPLYSLKKLNIIKALRK